VPERDDPRIRLLSDMADATRFGILEQLEQGPTSATALAQRLGVSPTQLANHLRRLREAELVTVEHQGRLAIYRLAEPGLREIFSMLNGLRGTPATPQAHAPEGARCYDHLAGRLGVALLDHLIAQQAVEPREGEGQLALGPRAGEVFRALGVDDPHRRSRRIAAYACMDSNLGRPHLGGRLGATLAHSLKTTGWVRNTQPRRLTLTPKGRAGLEDLGLRI